MREPQRPTGNAQRTVSTELPECVPQHLQQLRRPPPSVLVTQRTLHPLPYRAGLHGAAPSRQHAIHRSRFSVIRPQLARHSCTTAARGVMTQTLINARSSPWPSSLCRIRLLRITPQQYPSAAHSPVRGAPSRLLRASASARRCPPPRTAALRAVHRNDQAIYPGALPGPCRLFLSQHPPDTDHYRALRSPAATDQHPLGGYVSDAN